MSSTAPSQLTRSANACDACRRRKVKCSGTMPCQSCIRHRMECKFGNSGRRGYSDAYVQGLLDTIKQQEERLKEKSAAPETPIKEISSTQSIASPEQGVVPIEALTPGRAIKESLTKSPAAELASGPVFESRVRSLLRDHAEGGHSSHASPEDSMLISEVPDDRLASQWRSSKELLDDAPAPTLLSKERSYQLFEQFITLLGINQHYLDQRTFSDSLTLLYQGEAIRDRRMETMWFTQYLLVMALGMLIGTPNQVSQNSARHSYFAEAMRRLPPTHELGSHGVIAVEILCLIALYLQWCDRKHDAYLHIGGAVRLAMALGCSLPHDEQRGLPSEICHRVRVWWTAYMLDQRLSAALGLPMAVDDRQLRADLPKPSAGFQPPLPLIINIKIAQITSEIMASFYGHTEIPQAELIQKIQSTLLSLYETGKSIPNTLTIDFAESEVQVTRTGASLYLMLLQAMILCLRPIILQSVKEKVGRHKRGIPSPAKDDRPPLIPRLCHACQEAALKSIKILSALKKQGTIALFGYFDLDATFSAAFILLAKGFIRSSDPENAPKGLAEAAGILQFLADSGNKSAEQKLNDLKQFCYHVWTPDRNSKEWKWLSDFRSGSAVPLIDSPMPDSIPDVRLAQGVQLNQMSQLQSFWPEEWDGWFNEIPNSAYSDPQNAMFAYNVNENFEMALSHQADEIYTSFNDPALPLTGVDDMDWAEMEKIFRPTET